MKKTPFLTLVVTLVAISAMIFAPLVSDSGESDSVEVDGVVISSFTEEAKVAAGNHVSVDLSLFNNNNNDVIVKLSYTSNGSPIKVSYSSSDPISISGVSDTGSVGVPVVAYVNVDKYAAQGTYEVDITATVSDNLGNFSYASLPLTVHVSSAYSSGTAFNKILGVFDNPLPEPFNTPVATALISFCLWIVISILVFYLANLVLIILLKDYESERKDIQKKTGKLLIVCVLIYGVSNCMRIIGANEVFVAAVIDFSLLLYIVLGSIIIWGIYKVFISHLFHKMEKDGRVDGVDSSLIPLFNMMGKIVIVVLAVAWILAILGFDLLAIVTGAGIAGLAISLGAQSTLNEFFSGLSLLITRPFRENDMIRLDTGTEILEVKRVGLMNTEFKNWANYEHFTMPNSAVVKSTIVNLTGKTRAYRVFLYFGVAYDSNMELVKKLMRDAAYEHPQVITDGSFDKPDIRLTSFDDSCITLRLAVYVNDFEDNGIISGELREAVFKKFNDNGVEIPFTQVDIHIKDVKESVQ